MSPSCAEGNRGSSIVGSAPRENAYLVIELAKPWPGKIKKADGAVAELRALLKGCAEDVSLLATPRIDWLPLCQRPWAILIRWTAQGALVQELSAKPNEVKAALAEPAQGKIMPLYLVCTHGSRDRCCGTLGFPVYRALQAEGSRKVLQVSHLGGHRYAPVVMALPEWRFFGHLDPESCLTMDRALSEGRPVLSGYRGHGRLPESLQPIEARLWDEYGTDLLRVRALGGSDGDEVTVQATFRDGNQRSYRARLGFHELHGYKSCEDADEGKMKTARLPSLLSLHETAVSPSLGSL